MAKELIKVIAPAAFASAIFNNDYSGLSKADVAELNNFLLNEGLSFADCVDVSDNYVGRFNGLLADVADYSFFLGA